jgi:hypothetical protein
MFDVFCSDNATPEELLKKFPVSFGNFVAVFTAAHYLYLL